MEIGLLLLLLLMIVVMRWWIKNERGSTNATEAGGFRHDSDAATRCHRARMRVRAFVGRDYNRRII